MSGLYGACDVQGVISGAVVPATPVPGGCTENLPRCYWQPLRCLVTSSSIKSDVVPALRAGAASLFSAGGARWWVFAQVSLVKILDVVTICMVGARRRATGGASGVSEPART